MAARSRFADNAALYEAGGHFKVDWSRQPQRPALGPGVDEAAAMVGRDLKAELAAAEAELRQREMGATYRTVVGGEVIDG